MKKHTYLGLFLSGVKKDKSTLIALEKYKDHNRVVVSEIEKQFKDLNLSNFPDEVLINQINSYSEIDAIGVNFPISLPPCISCERECPGVEDCTVQEVQWLVREYNKSNTLTKKSGKEPKIPSPYSERAIDFYLANYLEQEFSIEPAMGATRSIFYSRGLFLRKRLKDLEFVECSPKISLWRIGKKYNIRKSVLECFYKSGKAHEHKEIFIKKLEKDFFFYQEDKEILLTSKTAFEALLCALSAYYFKNEGVEVLPQNISRKNFSVPS